MSNDSLRQKDGETWQPCICCGRP